MMKLSTFMMPIHPPGRNVTETLKEDREAVILASKKMQTAKKSKKLAKKKLVAPVLTWSS